MKPPSERHDNAEFFRGFPKLQIHDELTRAEVDRMRQRMEQIARGPRDLPAVLPPGSSLLGLAVSGDMREAIRRLVKPTRRASDAIMAMGVTIAATSRSTGKLAKALAAVRGRLRHMRRVRNRAALSARLLATGRGRGRMRR